MRDTAYVGAGRCSDGKQEPIAFESPHDKRVNFNLNGGEIDGLLLSREFIGGNSVNLLCRYRRRRLEKSAAKSIERCRDFRNARRVYSGGLHKAVGIVGIGGEAEPDFGFIGLHLFLEEASEARGGAGHYEEQAGCHWVEGAEMSCTFGSCKPAPTVHNIMACAAFRFVDENESVHFVNGT